MATAPLIKFFDNTGFTNNLVFTTNNPNVTFYGEVDSNTVDVQININNSGFVSDPSLVSINIPNITVPNLSSYPNGLELEKGVNVIQLRAIDITGSVSQVTTINANLVNDSDLGVIFEPPSGIQLERNATSITLSWSSIDLDVIGYNIYASTGQGGTSSGYLKVNSTIISTDSPVETIDEDFLASSYSYNFQDEDSLDLQIIGNTIDPVSGAVVEQKTSNSYPLIQSPNYKYEINIYNVISTKKFRYTHDRDAGLQSGVLNNDIFSSILPSDPLFYVVTAVYFDGTTNTLQESRYSSELSGSPLPLNSVIRGIKIREQKIISQDYIKEIQKKEPTLSLIPGSTVREVHIEPNSNEFQKVYFLADFVHRAKSFEALLAIDDPGYTGVSVPVNQSQYKQNLQTALSINDATAVQSLIDNSFDSLAANFGITRDGPKAAQIIQTFFTYTRPTRDLIVNQGAVVNSSTNSLAPRFISKSTNTMFSSRAQSYYNPDKKRYEIKVQMIADTPGSVGNLPANSLDTVAAGVSGLQTINEVSTTPGFDVQSNLQLAEECMRVIPGVDTGTSPGYDLTSIRSPGVEDSFIVSSGDKLMMRDYDDVRKKHIGGKVDIYVRGVNERTVTERFAFQFSIARNIRFEIIDPVNLIFRARDSRLSVNNPIQDVLYNPSQNLGLRNYSNLPTSSYDLTGVTILDYQTIQLNILIPQPETFLDDFVEGDYRFRNNNKFVASIQPIRSITSVVGVNSGPLEAGTGYTLFKTQDPLLEGDSVRASDYLEINQVDNIPSGNITSINDEQHVMIGQFSESLNSVGVNILSIRVYSQDRDIEFFGPNSSSPDYTIESGSQTEPTKIIRTNNSSIPNGSIVSVDYEHDENFTITYVVNDVLQNLNTRIQNSKHATADVLVKQSNENLMDLEMTVQLLQKSDTPTSDSAIRTSVSNITGKKSRAVYQSDITSSVETSSGVDFVIQPLTKMTIQDGSLRIREPLDNTGNFINSLSLFNNAVYILTEPLIFATSDGGGPLNSHTGVYMDDLIMERSNKITEVGEGLNKFYIIGNNGAIITGYSDNATIISEGYDEDEIEARRKELTSNRVLVSLNNGLTPPDSTLNHKFDVTYTVSGDSGSKDLSTNQIQFISPGNITITYRNP